ncbi:MAG: hypothetical protein H6765_00470 [Candidatus Peribacteria bacterium]|nr:MAG: hypothetical protein H6765_00470 [Candidatus Peribacteria bacterium]
MSPLINATGQPNNVATQIAWFINGVSQGTFSIGTTWGTAYTLVIPHTGPGTYVVTFQVVNFVNNGGPHTALLWEKLGMEGLCGHYDLEWPEITCPPDVTVSCMSQVPAPYDGLIVTDDCNDVNYWMDEYTTGICPKYIHREYYAMDNANHLSFCQQKITVWDNIPPVISCPPNVDWGCDVPGNSGVATATDNCNPNVAISYQDSVVYGPNGLVTIYRHWVAADAPGTACCNYSYCTQVISYKVGDFDQTALLSRQNTGQKVITDACMTTTVYYSYPHSYQGYYPAPANMGNALGVWTTEGLTLVVDGSTDLQDGKVRIEVSTLTTIPSFNPTVPNNYPDSLTYSFNGIPTRFAVPLGWPGYVIELDAVPGDTIRIFGLQSDITQNGGQLSVFYATNLYQEGNCGGCVDFEINCSSVPHMELPCGTTMPIDTSITGTPTFSLQPDTSFYSDVVVNSPNCIGGYITTITRTWTGIRGTDTVSCTQVIGIFDNEPPVIVNCPADLTVTCGGAFPPADTGNVVTDDCSTVTVTVSDNVSGSVLTRTYTATDACGNSASCVQVITKEAFVAVTIDCPDDLTLNVGDTVPPVNLNQVVSNGTVELQSQNATTDSCNTTVVRVFVAFNSCDTTTCSQTITIPLASTLSIQCPADVTLNAGQAIPSPDPASVVILSGNGTVVHAGDQTATVGCETIVVRTYVATDPCGNTVSCQQVITQQSGSSFSIQCPPTTLLGNDPVPAPDTASVVVVGGNGTEEVTFVEDVTTVDGCQTVTVRTYEVYNACDTLQCQQVFVQYQQNVLEFTEYPLDTIIDKCQPLPTNWTFSWPNCTNAVQLQVWSVGDTSCQPEIEYFATLVDQFGNSSDTVSWFVYLEDTQAPTLVSVQQDLNVECGTNVTIIPPVFTDCSAIQVDSVMTVTQTPCTTTWTITWTAVDCAGNSATVEQTVQFTDTQAPVLPNLPTEVTLDNLQDQLDSLVTIYEGLFANDECAGQIPLEVSFDIVDDSTAVIHLSVSDPCGNTASINVNITVESNGGNPTGPTIKVCLIKVWPNPNQGSFHVRFEVPGGGVVPEGSITFYASALHGSPITTVTVPSFTSVSPDIYVDLTSEISNHAEFVFAKFVAGTYVDNEAKIIIQR